MATTPSSVFKVKHETDPAEDIRKAVGDISKFRLPPGKLLLGIYKRPEKVGGIIRIDSTRDEDVWQGKAWIVLGMGPLCFKDSDQGAFGGYNVKVGEWVLARANDGYRMDICGEGGKDGYQCLVLDHKFTKGVTPDPSMVW